MFETLETNFNVLNIRGLHNLFEIGNQNTFQNTIKRKQNENHFVFFFQNDKTDKKNRTCPNAFYLKSNKNT